MAEVEKLMGVDAGDIEKIMGVSKDDIEKIMGVEIPASGPAWGGTRGIQFGGNVSGISNQIQYRTIQSTSDTADFGNLVLARDGGGGATSNIARAIMHDGNEGSTYSGGVMDYVTVGSTGHATDFGDITGESIGSNGAAMSNGTLAFMCAGFDTSGTYRDLDMSYVTIASTGNSTDAGDIIEGKNYVSSSSGDTRGLIWNGM
jgi:hypothetical protein